MPSPRATPRYMMSTAVSRPKQTHRHERSFADSSGGTAMIGRDNEMAPRTCIVLPPDGRTDWVAARDVHLPASAVPLAPPTAVSHRQPWGARPSSVDRRRSRSAGRERSRTVSRPRSGSAPRGRSPGKRRSSRGSAVSDRDRDAVSARQWQAARRSPERRRSRARRSSPERIARRHSPQRSWRRESAYGSSADEMAPWPADRAPAVDAMLRHTAAVEQHAQDERHAHNVAPTLPHNHNLQGVETDDPVQAALLRVMSDAIKSRRSLFGKKMKSIRAVFKAVDRDGSGSIDRDELREALHRLDIELKDRQLAQLFNVIDEDGDGTIDVNELERWLRAAGAEDHPASPPTPNRTPPSAVVAREQVVRAVDADNYDIAALRQCFAMYCESSGNVGKTKWMTNAKFVRMMRDSGLIRTAAPPAHEPWHPLTGNASSLAENGADESSRSPRSKTGLPKAQIDVIFAKSLRIGKQRDRKSSAPPTMVSGNTLGFDGFVFALHTIAVHLFYPNTSFHSLQPASIQSAHRRLVVDHIFPACLRNDVNDGDANALSLPVSQSSSLDHTHHRNPSTMSP